MTAWTITALNGLKSTLENDATLQLYVDTFAIGDRARGVELPDMTRHAIHLFPEGLDAATVHSPTRLTQFFRVRMRLSILVWDPTDEDAVITGTTVVGVGTSTVGILQFVEDVRDAVRRDTQSNLLEETGHEGDSAVDFLRIPVPDRDRVFYEAEMTWSGEYYKAIDGSN